ncbi:RagB/SusD family nutrient uptake outer membrane protein [Taibaiella helva]|uniref:RagB/SusD family nutrient uptake outer membrane protein n=1 Tax=Taibaiella helva TaxID=2301235 RepID=UPI0018E57E3C|nr:RagB/SusD family nutrient uptake outer membrane protein [Taibaiella helva]
MKTSIKIVGAFIAIGMLACSCNKQFEQNPSNAVPGGGAFNTVKDFNVACLGMYYEMTHTEYYLAGSDDPVSWISTMDLMADNLISQQTGRGSQRSFGNWQYNASNTTGMFADAYSIIRAANSILENIGNVGDAPERANFEGEALTVRAMVHFDLLRIYSRPVSGPQAAPNGLGVPYVTTTDINDAPGRGTVKDAYDKVVADLVRAVDLINASNGSGRLNKAATYALLSRVYLYGGEWQKCVDASSACLAIKNDPGSITTFPGIWTDQSEAGVIFKLMIKTQDRLGGQPILIGNGYSQSISGSIKSEWVAAHSLALMYDTLKDVRAKAYLVNATFGGQKYRAIAKHLGRPGGTPRMVDLKYLRVAEVILNRAEAYTQLNSDATALEDLDLLRKNRYTPFTAGAETGEALKKAIAKERRLEMAFEGDRWFDLKRKGLPVARDQFGDYADGTGTPYFVKDLPAGDPRWQLPLGQRYINANANLEQNPGY